MPAVACAFPCPTMDAVARRRRAVAASPACASASPCAGDRCRPRIAPRAAGRCAWRFPDEKTAAAVAGRSGAAPRGAARAALAPVRSRSRCRGRRGGRRGRGRKHTLARHRADGSPPARPRRSRSDAPPQSRPARRARNRAHHLRENEGVFAALRPGTVGYLFNDSPSAELGAAIRRAARGESLRPESRLDRVNPTLIFLRVARGLLALVVAPLAPGARKGGDGPRRWARSPAALCSGCSRVPSCSRSPAASSSSSRAVPPPKKAPAGNPRGRWPEGLAPAATGLFAFFLIGYDLLAPQIDASVARLGIVFGILNLRLVGQDVRRFCRLPRNRSEGV